VVEEAAMSVIPEIKVVPIAHTTGFAPLVVLGYWLQAQDLFAPLWSRVQFPQPLHTLHPQAALVELFVSILAGCRSIRQVNTKIRPDPVLAQAWGRAPFAEQSTLARVLDACQAEQVQQLQEGVTQVYRWIGLAPQHDWRQPLEVDVDLTFLPASSRAQGSTKGYASGKRGSMDGNCAGSGSRPRRK
jgi:hypothetical protein